MTCMVEECKTCVNKDQNLTYSKLDSTNLKKSAHWDRPIPGRWISENVMFFTVQPPVNEHYFFTFSQN